MKNLILLSITMTFTSLAFSQEIVRDIRVTRDYYETYCIKDKRFLFRGFKSESMIEDCQAQKKKCALVYSGSPQQQIINSVCK